MTSAERGQIAAKLGGGLATALALTMQTIPGDATIDVSKDGSYLLTKGSAAAIALPVPGAANIGRVIQFTGGSDFAHVVTAASTSVHDGTTGGHGTLTSPAFQGGTLTLRAISATKYNVISNQLWVIT